MRAPAVTEPRWRWRFIPWSGVHSAADTYPEGWVYRLWLGWVLITVMVPA